MDLRTSEKFAVICQHKDTNASNINEVFESMGCDSLEAMVPVVQRNRAEGIQNANHDKKLFETLAIKGESGSNYAKGRNPRTKDRDLSMKVIGKDTIIVLGKERDRSPVDRGDLDDDLEKYMEVTKQSRTDRQRRIEAERIRLAKEGSSQARLFETPKMAEENLTLSFDALLKNMKSQR